MVGATHPSQATIPASETIWIRGANASQSGLLKLIGTVTNYGTIKLESVDDAWESDLKIMDGVLVNLGTIQANRGSAGPRNFIGDLNNQGILSITSSSLALNGEFTQTAEGELSIGI